MPERGARDRRQPAPRPGRAASGRTREAGSSDRRARSRPARAARGRAARRSSPGAAEVDAGFAGSAPPRRSGRRSTRGGRRAPDPETGAGACSIRHEGDSRLEKRFSLVRAEIARLRVEMDAEAAFRARSRGDLGEKLAALGALDLERQSIGKARGRESLKSQLGVLEARNQTITDEGKSASARLSLLDKAGALCPVCSTRSTTLDGIAPGRRSSRSARRRSDEYRENKGRIASVGAEISTLDKWLAEAERQARGRSDAERAHARAEQATRAGRDRRPRPPDREGSRSRAERATGGRGLRASRGIGACSPRGRGVGARLRRREARGDPRPRARPLRVRRQTPPARGGGIRAARGEGEACGARPEARRCRDGDCLAIAPAPRRSTASWRSRTRRGGRWTRPRRCSPRPRNARAARARPAGRLSSRSAPATTSGRGGYRSPRRSKRRSSSEATYDDLALAFGKKGIQAMIIEGAIPEIEREANDILARMTDGRLNVKFETQRVVPSRGQHDRDARHKNRRRARRSKPRALLGRRVLPGELRHPDRAEQAAREARRRPDRDAGDRRGLRRRRTPSAAPASSRRSTRLPTSSGRSSSSPTSTS